MNTLFAFYFNLGLHLTQSQSTIMTNLALAVNYGSAIIGGIIADSYLGT
jgi:dipeptide/tripeptide permease